MGMAFAIGKETCRVAMISYVDFFTEFVYPKTQEVASTAIAGVESKENERFLYSLGRTAGEGMESYSIQSPGPGCHRL